MSALRIRGPWTKGLVVGIPIGICVQLVAVAAFLVVQRVVSDFSPEKAMGVIEREFQTFSLSAKVALLAVGGVVGPVAEELLFRGVLLYGLQLIKGRWGKAFAAIGSAALFAAVHLNAWAFVAFLVLGLILAGMTIKTGSVSYAIGTHIGFNLAAFGALLLR
ncbi:MAG: hypothetical protein C4318_08630 [Acidimicrobiia bacterium]